MTPTVNVARTADASAVRCLAVRQMPGFVERSLALRASAVDAASQLRPRRPVAGPASPHRCSRRWSRSSAPAACNGLAIYQSGFLISADGHVLTVWSYVLDIDDMTVMLDDGRKYQSKLVGADPRLELAVLKIDARICRTSIWPSRRPPPKGPACWPSATCSAWPPATSRRACSTARSRPSRRSTPAAAP